MLRSELYTPQGRHVATWNSTLNTNQNIVGLFYNHADWLGTERVRTNSSGTAVEWCTDTPYGMNMACGGQSDSSSMHYAGLQYDPETAMSHALNRQLTMNRGRWLTPDPIGKDAAHLDDPQTWNMYAYVRNNPTTLTDPSGNDWREKILNYFSHNGWGDDKDVYGPPPPAPPSLSGEAKNAFRESLSGYHPNGGKETVAKIAGIVNGETQGMKDSKSENVPLSTAREEIAHVRINSDEAYGNKVDRRAGMAPMKMSGPDFQRSLDAAINAASQNAQGVDPTHGAIRMNMRTSMGDTSNYQGFPIHTQAGPYISPTKYKVVNTYGP